MNDLFWKTAVRVQLGAAIETLERAVRACPDDLWGDRSRRPEFWYTVYHTLFWLDLYLSDFPATFAPPAPFTLSELDPAGLLPERVYTRDEMLAYLEHCRRKSRQTVDALTDDGMRRRYMFGSVDLDFGELLLYVMRHVQHHAAQLNLILRQTIDSAPGWVFRGKAEVDDPPID